MVDRLHQIPENALRNASGCASCSALYMQSDDTSMSIRMMKTDEKI